MDSTEFKAAHENGKEWERTDKFIYMGKVRKEMKVLEDKFKKNPPKTKEELKQAEQLKKFKS